MKDLDTEENYFSPDIHKLKKRIEELETALVECKLIEEALRKSEKKHTSILFSMDDLVFVLGMDGTFHKYFQSAEKKDLFALPKNFMGKHFRDVLPQDVAESFQNAIFKIDDYGSAQSFDFLVVINGRDVWFNTTICPLRTQSKDYFGYVVVMRNITERKLREDALIESEAKYRAIMQESTESIFLADVETRVILEANESLKRMLGYSLEEIPGLSLYDFVSNWQDDLYQKIIQILKERHYYKGEMQYRRKDGNLVDVEICVNLISYRGRKVFCVISQDISPRKLAERQLIHTATHDPLTGLTNRLLFYDRIAVELARARRNQKMLALIYIDLDRFKVINDTLGHSAGDQLLRDVAERLKMLTRETDTLARMGGDEFMYLLTDVKDESDVRKVAQKVLGAVRKPFLLDGSYRHITASMGTAFYPQDGKDSETLMKAADLAMYFAKDEGRNNVLSYKPQMTLKTL
ncbi:MAG: diguanylate cyclase [Candidatus Aminicenantes bacterium]|nr:diguanylate cyclase [Candidatus Aminicenantes bacterium]